jgi:hypothetical protein
MILEDGVEDQYPRAEIFQAGMAVPVATLDLPHVALGRYEASWTPASPGMYSAHFIVYSDPVHSVENITYTREIESVYVTDHSKDDLAAMIVRILGLVHENAFIDNTVHDIDGQLVAARVRIFDSKDHVDLATDGGNETTGLVAVYEMVTSYESKGQMGSYKMKKVL